MVRKLVKLKANVNTASDLRGTPLHWACRWGNKEIVDLLLKSGATSGIVMDISLVKANTLREDHTHARVRETWMVQGVPVAAVRTALLLAAQFGHHSCAQMLLESMNERNGRMSVQQEGQMALRFAICNNSIDCVRLLLESGISSNSDDDPQGNRALLVAFEHKRWDICEELLTHNARTNVKNQDGDSILGILLSSGIADIKTFLLARWQSLSRGGEGAHKLRVGLVNWPGGGHRESAASQRGPPESVIPSKGIELHSSMPASPARPPSVARLTASGIDLSDPDVQTVLRELVEMGITANQIEDNAGFIKTYLEQDKATAAAKAEKKERSARAPPPPPPGNLSPYHRTLTHDPVTHMVNSECDQFLKILLQNLGGNIDVADSLGNTALSLATSVGDLAAMKRLLDASARTELSNDSAHRRPLTIAVERRHVEAVELLLSKGANPTVTHADGWTALHSAAKYGDIEIIERLVKAGAELDTKTANGHTPVEIALDSKKLKAMEALVRLGATPVDPMLLI